jgi:hypothetical protein
MIYLALQDYLTRHARSTDRSISLEKSTGAIKIFNYHGFIWTIVQLDENYRDSFQINVITNTGEVVPRNQLIFDGIMFPDPTSLRCEFGMKVDTTCQNQYCTCLYVVASWMTHNNNIKSIVGPPVVAYTKYNITKEQKREVFCSFVSTQSFESLPFDTLNPNIPHHIRLLSFTQSFNYIIYHCNKPDSLKCFEVVSHSVGHSFGLYPANLNLYNNMTMITQRLHDFGYTLQSEFGLINPRFYIYKRGGARSTGQKTRFVLFHFVCHF